MSHFTALTRHPETGEWQEAAWIDDHFGRHRYGVMFADGRVFDPRMVEMPTVGHEEMARRIRVTLESSDG